MIPTEKLDQLNERFQFLEARLQSGLSGTDLVAMSREYTELRPVVASVTVYRKLLAELAGTEAMLADPEMRGLAEEELPGLRARLEEAEREVQRALVPRDAADARPAMIEAAMTMPPVISPRSAR